MSKEKAAEGTAAPEAKAQKKGNRMYLGPTIIGAARHGTVFKDGVLPKKAQEYIAEFPVMEKLFVAVDKTPEAVRELRKKQSSLGAVYDQVEARFGASRQKHTRRV